MLEDNVKTASEFSSKSKERTGILEDNVKTATEFSLKSKERTVMLENIIIYYARE